MGLGLEIQMLGAKRGFVGIAAKPVAVVGTDITTAVKNVARKLHVPWSAATIIKVGHFSSNLRRA